MPFTSVDPVTGKEIERFEFCSEGELSTAIGDLHASFKEWKKLEAPARQKIFAKVLERMRSDAGRLASLMTLEMGKPAKDAAAEVEKCMKTIEKVLEQDLGLLANEKIPSIYPESVLQHEPLGVIYAVMPWNFPLWQVVRMFTPALLSGNTVLLKHSEITPLMGKAIEKLFTGLFAGGPLLLNLNIEHERTGRILRDSRVGGVSLTGSVRAGGQIYQSAAASFKKVVLELGGSDPYLVLKDADLKIAADKIAKSRLTNNGQTCIAAKRAIVHHDVLPEFLQLVQKAFDAYKFGPPSEPSTDLGPLAHPKFKEGLKKQIEAFVRATGARRVYVKPHGQKGENSAFVDAEIYQLEKNSEWLSDQEFFGPVLIVIPFRDEQEAVNIANSTDFALGAAVFSKDQKRAGELAQDIVAGQVTINDMIITDLSMPFGGFKSSGLGRELGREAYFEFTQTKVISRQ